MKPKQVSVHKAIIHTLSYADIFDYPLTAKEIYYYLIWESLSSTPSLKSVSEILRKSPAHIEQTNKYFTLKNRTQIVPLRRNRQKWSRKKIKIATRVSKWLKLVPSVKAVAVTGALAMNNSGDNDDIDLMLITKKNYLWLTRIFSIIVVSFIAKRRHPTQVLKSDDKWKTTKPRSTRWNNFICLNLFLDKSSLAIPGDKRNLYTAHEVAQTKFLWSKDNTQEQFLSQNSWINSYLPNIKISKEPGSRLKKQEKIIKKFINETILAKLESLAYRFQLRYMKKRITNEIITPHSAFFHPRDTGKIILKKYRKRINY